MVAQCMCRCSHGSFSTRVWKRLEAYMTTIRYVNWLIWTLISLLIENKLYAQTTLSINQARKNCSHTPFFRIGTLGHSLPTSAIDSRTQSSTRPLDTQYSNISQMFLPKNRLPFITMVPTWLPVVPWQNQFQRMEGRFLSSVGRTFARSIDYSYMQEYLGASFEILHHECLTSCCCIG